MNSKEEIIKEAWNEHQANFSLETGWAVTYVCNGIDDFSKEMQEYFDVEYVEQDIMRYRPKSLQGIEDNNGWISINSEEDLPKDEKASYWVADGDYIFDIPVNLHQVHSGYKRLTYNKYQPIIKPKPPIH